MGLIPRRFSRDQRPVAAAICAFALVLVTCLSAAQNYQQPKPFLTNLGNAFCAFGTCDIATPVYINVYWDSSIAQWNTDVMAASPAMTVDRIDTLTRSLVQSQYFKLLSPYSVTSVTTMPSIVASQCGVPPPTINELVNDNNNEMTNFVTCVLQHNPQINTSLAVLNVFLPPQTGALLPTTDFCTITNGQNSTAEHAQFAGVEVTILPTNSMCNGSIGSISAAMTHEMVEGTTDPNTNSPTGWKVPSIALGFTGDEIADICEADPRSQLLGPNNSNPATQVSRQSFLYGFVSTYYSVINSVSNPFAIPSTIDQGNCVPLPPANVTSFTATASASAFGPVINSVSACGSGSSMAFSVQVNDLGPTPWDLSPQGSSTVYASISVDATARGGGTWSAGGLHNFPADTVDFGSIVWPNPDSSGNAVIQLNDFAFTGGTAGYGSPGPNTSAQVVRPGDTVTVNLFDTNFGQSVSMQVQAPGPTQFSGLTVASPPYLTLPSAVISDSTAQWFFVDQNGVVSGLALGGCGAGIEGAAVTVTSGDRSDVFAPTSTGSLTTNNGGFFAVGYTPMIAGQKTLTASVPALSGPAVNASTSAAVHPGLSIISPSVGPVGQHAVLSGAGFSSSGGHASGVNFIGASSVPATSVSVNTPGKISLVVPSAPGPLVNGALVVDVVVNVDNVPSLPLAYTYIVPAQPALQPNSQCRNNNINVNVYDSLGKPINETVALTSAPAMFSSTAPVCSATVSCPCQAAGSAAGTSTCVQTPGTVSYLATGTVTATPVGSGGPSTTGKFSLAFCPPSEGEYEPIWFNGLYPQFGGIGPESFRSTLGGDGAVWSTNPASLASGDFVEIAGRTIRGLYRDLEISAPSIYELRGLIRQNRAILVFKGTASRSIGFTGKSVRISGSMAAPALSKNTATISFSLPRYSSQPADYRIFRLMPGEGSSAWIELRSLPAGPHARRTLQARISETGVYALATVKAR